MKSIHQDDPRRTSKDYPTRMAHTPGPWTLEVRESDGGEYAPARNATVVGADGNPVISMAGRMNDEIGNSDLRLIAAAPDLLSVAKFQQAADEGEPWAGEKISDMLLENDGHDYRTEAQLFMFLRRAVIAKVEGI